MSHEPDTQLEWFNLPRRSPAPRRPLASGEPFRVRPDHAVLGLILFLIGGSIVFAVGVERGKQLLRAERWAQESSDKTTSATSPKSPDQPTPPAQKTVPMQGPRKPGKALAQQSGFAVQIVSYRQPQLALRELQRLKQRGEAAFTLTQQDRTMLLVGPFASRERASAKLANLKQRYHDCFVRTL